jgi:hypothetical protein
MASRRFAHLAITAVLVACAACEGKTQPAEPAAPAPPKAVLEISAATVSPQRVGPGTRYTVIIEVRETGGADLVLDSVDVEYHAANWNDLAHFKVADVFAVDRLRALEHLTSRSISWTSSSDYRSARISIAWTDAQLHTGTASRVVAIPAF